MVWAIWWVWLVGALALATLEIFAPGYLFLGFAIGASATGILLGIPTPVSAWMAGSLPITLLVFAGFSLAGWILLRKVLGVRDGQVKIWHRDINED